MFSCLLSICTVSRWLVRCLFWYYLTVVCFLRRAVFSFLQGCLFAVCVGLVFACVFSVYFLLSFLIVSVAFVLLAVWSLVDEVGRFAWRNVSVSFCQIGFGVRSFRVLFSVFGRLPVGCALWKNDGGFPEPPENRWQKVMWFFEKSVYIFSNIYCFFPVFRAFTPTVKK